VGQPASAQPYLELQEQGSQPNFLICDNDKKFPFAFEHVFAGEGTRVIRTPLRAPQANAYPERWVGIARSEYLDWPIVGDRHHLERLLDEYVDHYNNERPHRGLQLHPSEWPVARRDRHGRDQLSIETRRIASRVLTHAEPIRCMNISSAAPATERYDSLSATPPLPPAASWRRRRARLVS
jgi:hypothetical protein